MEVILHFPAGVRVHSSCAGGRGCVLSSHCGKSDGFGVPRSCTGRETLLGGTSLQEAKQARQGLVAGRMHTAGRRGIVLGEGLLTIAIHGACREETTTRETTLTLPAPYCISWSVPPNLHWPQIPLAAPAWDTSTLPGRGWGYVCWGTGQSQQRTSATSNACSHKTGRW